MKKSLSIERLFFLGDFKNIKVGASLEDIPEEISSNEDAIRLLIKDLMLNCDLAYQDYKEYNERIKNERGLDMMKALEEEKAKVEEQYKVTIEEGNK